MDLSFAMLVIIAIGFRSSSFVNGECRLKNSREPHASLLLNRIKPLYGETFQYSFYDDKISDNYTYFLRICDGVQRKDYQSDDVGVLQQDKKGKYVAVGSINNATIKGGTDWIMLSYTNGKPYHTHCKNSKRQAHIMIVCDPYNLKGDFKVLYEENDVDEESDCFYMMELSSNVACTYSNTGLSSGSIFLIVFFTVVGVYLILGSIYKRCVYGSKGMDQVPNIGFWKTCGSLQADGCNYLCKCTGSGYYSNKPYQGVADDQLDEEIDDEHLLPM